MRSKLQLILILVIAIGTPVAATLLYWYAPPTGTTNRGEMLAPIALPAGLVPAVPAAQETWHLLVVGPADCDQACRARLCVINQARLVHLGELQRIGRLWLAEGTDLVANELTIEPSCGRQLPAAAQQSELIDVLAGVIVHQATVDILALLPPPAAGLARNEYIYVIDPQGRVMMRYPETTAVKDVASDLGRLLRLSRRAG